jgi:hypothetical protein
LFGIQAGCCVSALAAESRRRSLAGEVSSTEEVVEDRSPMTRGRLKRLRKIGRLTEAFLIVFRTPWSVWPSREAVLLRGMAIDEQ